LELRSKIHDEMLMERELQAQATQPSSFTTSFTLPLVALLVAFFLFLGVSQLSSPYQSDYHEMQQWEGQALQQTGNSVSQ